MPELPEVHTTVSFLQNKILGQQVQDFWSDTLYIFKYPRSIGALRKALVGKQIRSVRRVGKYILIDLSGNVTLVLHQKMTGHLLLGKWMKKAGSWVAPARELREKVNSYIRFIITFRSGLQLALSDARKFAAVYLWPTADIGKLKYLNIGSDAESISKNDFLSLLNRRTARIKTFLMNQRFISGIGNIYSDELLWDAGVHPLRKISSLSEKEKVQLFRSMRKVLRQAIRAEGTSISDYRKPDGSKGRYSSVRRVYRREGQKCGSCRGIIQRIKIGQRSSYFCPQHQK